MCLSLSLCVHGSVLREGWHVFNCVVATIRRCYDNTVYLQTLWHPFKHNHAPFLPQRRKSFGRFLCTGRNRGSCWRLCSHKETNPDVVDAGLLIVDYERDCRDRRQSSFNRRWRGNREKSVSSRCINLWSKSSPRWWFFVTTHNQFRSPKWNDSVLIEGWMIHMQQNKWHILSVHVLISFQSFLSIIMRHLNNQHSFRNQRHNGWIINNQISRLVCFSGSVLRQVSHVSEGADMWRDVGIVQLWKRSQP